MIPFLSKVLRKKTTYICFKHLRLTITLRIKLDVTPLYGNQILKKNEYTGNTINGYMCIKYNIITMKQPLGFIFFFLNITN